MLVWYAGLAIAGVLLVFRDPRLDHRLVAAGSIAPQLLDFAFGAAHLRLGEVGPFHSVCTHIMMLCVAMLISINRRTRRKRLLAFVIGGFAHLVIDASWADTAAFGWPITRRGFAGRLQIWSRPIALSIGLEIVGLAVGAFLYQRCRLWDPQRKRLFLHNGSLELLPPRQKRR